MRQFRAHYYDGRSSRAHEVWLTRRGEHLHVRGNSIAITTPLSTIRVSARVGNSPRFLNFADGAKCETDDHDAVDAIFTRVTAAHHLERRWSLAILATLLTAAFVWVGIEYGLPAMARHVAHAVPVTMEENLGQQSLQALDGSFMQESRLPEVDQGRVHDAFARVTATLQIRDDTQLPMQLLLRHSDALGANAFALPAGIVVFTDQMVELAQSDEELLAVIAHELGHVHHRHIMRSVLQNSVAAVLIAALLGDVTSVTGLAASIPTFLVEQRYSREFEFEADAFALQWMDSQQVDARHFTRILRRLKLSHHMGSQDAGHQNGDSHDDTASDIGKYLSTHPSMEERILAIEQR